MMQVNVGNGTPATRFTCIIISTHDPARLRPHVLAREGSVAFAAAGRFLRPQSLLRPHLDHPLVTESICWLWGCNTAQVSLWKIEIRLPSVMGICTFPNPDPVHRPDSSTCWNGVFSNSQDNPNPI